MFSQRTFYIVFSGNKVRQLSLCSPNCPSGLFCKHLCFSICQGPPLFLDYLFVTCSFFIIPCKAFLHWSSVISSLFSQAGLLIFLHVFLNIVMDCSCACNMLSLIKCQLSWAPLPFRILSHGIPCTSSLNKLKSALVKSWSILLAFLSPLGSWTPVLHDCYSQGCHWFFFFFSSTSLINSSWLVNSRPSCV